MVFQNCNEYVASGGGDWAGNFKNQTGRLWIHDVHFGGAYLTGGIELQDPGAAVVLRDVLLGSHTDGRWHLVQCAKGCGGMTRNVDGRLVASNTFTGRLSPTPATG